MWDATTVALSTNTCDLQVIPNLQFNIPMALMLQKKSPYTQLFNYQ
jgi:hypothetical protein